MEPQAVLPEALYARQSTLLARVDRLQRLEQELVLFAAGNSHGRPSDWTRLQRRHGDLEKSQARIHKQIRDIDEEIDGIQDSLAQSGLARSTGDRHADVEQWQIRRRIGLHSQFDEIYDEAVAFDKGATL